MDTKAEFGHAGGNALLLGGAWNGTGIKRHADASCAGYHAPGSTRDGGQISAVFSKGAGDLVDEQCSGHAACLG